MVFYKKKKKIPLNHQKKQPLRERPPSFNINSQEYYEKIIYPFLNSTLKAKNSLQNYQLRSCNRAVKGKETSKCT